MIQATRQFFGRFKKRAAGAPGAALMTSWPFGAIGGSIAGENLATVRRAVDAYNQIIQILKLETESGEPHYLIDLLERGPHPAYSKSSFFEALCFELLIHGNFICRLDYNKAGRITRINPFRGNTARAYLMKGGDYADPDSVAKGFYYRSSYSDKVWFPDSAIHLRDSLSSVSDMLNSPPRSYLYSSIFETGSAVQEVILGLAASGGRGPLALTGLPQDSTEQSKGIRDRVQRVLQSGLKTGGSQVMTFPEGWKIEKLLGDHAHNLIQFISERSDLSIAKLFSVPLEIIQAGQKTGAQTFKEIWRSFLKFPLRAFLSKVADGLSAAAGDGTRFKFRAGRYRFSDAREAGQFYTQMAQIGVLTAEEIKELLED